MVDRRLPDVDEFAGNLAAKDVGADYGPIVPAEHEPDQPFGRSRDVPRVLEMMRPRPISYGCRQPSRGVPL